ncbi:uncharacterized protein LOC111717856 [Eurytemora carolleeae]|uniref:uncharacterized protein LOC111717856 n=1 Tax=Eurytemora carolleeae TaxID=1294199 RepID=UPI000C760509|nr:uncharacterized protein LOC111717856 [Eurytemora carolleeae]|eukprot:XP_023349079.1 uncharacterized protein LOC111717856 [Eurytemora affinis]
MMMHSCIKNTRLTFSDDHVLTILCRTKVKKGDKIYHSYARTFTPTNIRRIGLFSGKHFSCECIRCKDPSELQTFLSAFTCSCGGQILAEDPLDLTPDAYWCCNSCDTRIAALEMAGKERGIMMETYAMKRDDPLGMETFLEKYKTVLHKNHAFILEVEKQLSVAYGSFPGFQIETLSDKRLARKICYCSHLLDILDILEPGISTQKGLSLYDLWKGKEEMLRRLGLKKDDSKYKSEKLKNSALLEESLRILEYEPTNSLHGAVKEEINRKLKEM